MNIKIKFSNYFIWALLFFSCGYLVKTLWSPDESRMISNFESKINSALDLADKITAQPNDYFDRERCCRELKGVEIDFWYSGDSLEYWTHGWDKTTFDISEFTEKVQFKSTTDGNILFYKNINENRDSIFFVFSDFVKKDVEGFLFLRNLETQSDIDTAVWTKVNIERENSIYQRVKVDVKSLIWPPIASLLVLISFVFFFLELFRYASRLASKNEYLYGVGVLILSWIGFNLFWYWGDFSRAFSGIPLYSTKINIIGSYTTLGLIIHNIVFVFLFVLYSDRNFPSLRSDAIKGTRKALWFSTFNYFLLMIGLYGITILYKNVLSYSDVIFDLENIFNIDFVSIALLLAVNLLLFSYFIFAYRLTGINLEIQTDKRSKYLSLGIASMAMFVLVIVSFGIQFFPLFIMGVLVFIFLLELFAEAFEKNVSWLILWLVITSFFSANLLFKFNNDKDINKHKEYLEWLSKGVDSTLHRELSEITSDLAYQNLVLGGACIDNNSFIAAQLRAGFRKSTYLTENYTVVNPSVEFENTDLCQPGFEVRKNNSDPLFYYSVKVKFPIRGSDCNCVTIEHDLNKNPYDWERIETNTVASSEFFHFSNKNNIDYAIYHKGHLSTTNANYFDQKQFDFQGITAGEILSQTVDNRRILVLTQDDSTVIVSDKITGLINMVSMFSFLFIIAGFFILILTIGNNYFAFLPAHFRLNFNSSMTLKYKIQFAFLSVLVISFVLIALITGYYFKSSATENTLSLLRNKAVVISTELNDNLPSFQREGGRSEFLKEVRKLARMNDIILAIYDAKGRRLEVGQNTTFVRKMPYEVYNYIKDENKMIVKEENTPHLYIPVLGSQDKLEYVFGLSTLSKSGNYNDSIKSFLSALLNVYVFLLLIASVVAIAVANSVSKPIIVLGQKIKEFRLGTRNQTLKWKNKDELGLLIQEYNSLIEKLEDSARLLAQTEREVAWREMAKQVAHEIKNPLTPMKLAIQYMEMSINRLGEEGMQDLVKKTSHTLIEQIDNLSKIASEFSSFAKMPKPQNEFIILNDLVASVHDLFNRSDDSKFNLYVPIDEVYVYADRSHLLRVLNNLLKNAIQSIPEGRLGEISLRLTREGNIAKINVIDNGEGISEEMQKKVFSPNFTTKTSGTGLGLAISKSIIESFGGKIYFDTVPDKGTDFCFELPIQEPKHTEYFD